VTVDRLRFHLWRLRDAVRERARGRSHREEIFRRIHDQNLWGDRESVSGGGSGTRATETIRRELPILFMRYGIRTLLDAPCGDFHWMQHAVDTLDRYVGVDIVPSLIERNAQRYGSDRIAFACADITADPLPEADAVLCRDCFIHLPTRQIRRALANFRASGIRYLLLTNDSDVEAYHDIPAGSFRRVNFLRPPFSFPEPLFVLNESTSGLRQLCLWEVETLFADGGRGRPTTEICDVNVDSRAGDVETRC
jgi:hypothetical protein